MTDHEIKLLISLCRQIDKYGIDTFISLVKKLKDTDTLQDLELLIPIAKKRIAITTNSKLNNKKAIELIENAKKEGKKYSDKLINIYETLKSNNSTSTISEINHFLSIHGKKKPTLNGKERLITYLINELLNNEDLLIEASHFFKNDDRSLSAWSDIIMKNKLPSDKGR
ncbi:TPA: hypothetical protein RG731_002396 [Morganella morganii subsp. morganii]|nr:hypothetical protein [Morganella morganii subsp. morganii]